MWSLSLIMKLKLKFKKGDILRSGTPEEFLFSSMRTDNVKHVVGPAPGIRYGDILLKQKFTITIKTKQ